jgi:hypothetical protein
MNKAQLLARRLGLDRNPLRRRTDRIATGLAALLLAGFLAGAPLLSIAAIGWTGRAGAAERWAQRSWREVPAVLLQAAPASTGFAAGVFGYSWVPARWTAPDGRVRTGEIPVGTGLAAGRAVQIWVDSAGLPAAPPLTSRAVVAREVTAAATATLALALVVLAVGVAGRWVFHRHRLAGWDTGWADVGPQWTRRFWMRG